MITSLLCTAVGSSQTLFLGWTPQYQKNIKLLESIQKGIYEDGEGSRGEGRRLRMKRS